MKKVVMDYGHGGEDPGAIGIGLLEKNLTLSIGSKVTKILRDHRVLVIETRTTDKTVSLKERSSIENRENPDAFVSIHINDHDNLMANGVETFSYPGSTKGTALAKCIQDELVKTKIFVSNRGVKTANFHVLRETKGPAALTELGFIRNVHDVQILKTKENELALTVAKGILNYLGIKYMDGPGFPIMSKTKATVEQMRSWARSKGANQLFIDLAPIFYETSVSVGVNPLVTYAQSAKETGFMKFGGVLNASFNNPCGLKTAAGGGDKDPQAHQRFSSWAEGIRGQVDHLALYAGAFGYPKVGTPDPRHFPAIRGTAATVEGLGRKWAPSPSYGVEIVRMVKEIEATVSISDPTLVDIRINLLGMLRTIKGRLRDQVYYLIVDGKEIPLRSVFESMGFAVTWENNMVVIR